MLGQAYAQYALKLFLFAVVVLLGIFVGSRLRKRKNKKDIIEVNEAKGHEFK